MESLLLPAPLSSLVGLLIVLGVAHLGFVVAARCSDDTERIALDRAGGFFVVTAALAGLLHALALAGVPHLLACARSIGVALAALGVLAVHRLVGAARPWVPRSRGAFRRLDARSRLSAIIVSITLLAYLMGALGPATDADSLDYHLGVPLDWLANGVAYPRPDWLHARLVGSERW